MGSDGKGNINASFQSKEGIGLHFGIAAFSEKNSILSVTLGVVTLRRELLPPTVIN